MTVVSPHLLAVGAAWEDGPDAGGWIADRLGPFGPSVGHAVPLGYCAYAVVPIPWDADPEGDRGPLDAVAALLEILGPYTGGQPVHCGMWDGWGWWHDTGTDPRIDSGVRVMWPESGPRRSREEIDRALAEAREEAATRRVERPDVEPLALPHRRYYVWTGPPRSATAFRHQPQDPPSLIWPEDRSWFIGAPIYTREMAVGGTTEAVAAVIGDRRLGARRATPGDDLHLDD